MLDTLIIFIVRRIVNTFSLISKIFLSSLFGHFVLYFHSCFFLISTRINYLAQSLPVIHSIFQYTRFTILKLFFVYFYCISNSFSIEYIVSPKNIFTDHKYRSVYE